MELSSMTILVTGAASGIGHALCLGFIDDGATVVAVDTNPDGLQPLAERSALTRIVDISDPVQVEEMVKDAVEKTGRLDVLINNAGVGFFSNLMEAEPGQFENVIRVNLFGPFYGMRAAIPVMRSQGFGRIINLLSRNAEIGANGNLAYGSSKAALFVVTRCVAMEVAEDNILINGLIPGSTKTGMHPMGEQDPSVVYPTARILATLPHNDPTGRVFWNEKEYFLFNPENPSFNLVRVDPETWTSEPFDPENTRRLSGDRGYTAI